MAAGIGSTLVPPDIRLPVDPYQRPTYGARLSSTRMQPAWKRELTGLWHPFPALFHLKPV
jgi:hypothetical protein